MKTSEQTDKIDAAIVAVQAEVEAVGKNKAVDASREGGGGGFKFKFATFSALLSAVRPVLSAHGVALYQGGRMTGASWSVVTRVSHAGQWIEVEYPIKASRDGAQGFGGGVSFAKRWGLRDLLAIEVPDDPEEGQGYKEAQRDARPAKRAAAPPGIADALKAIRDAQAVDTLADVAQRARAAFPTGESAAAVEKGLDAWFVSAFSEVVRAQSLDGFTELRDLVAKVKPRGRSVVDAMGEAARRLEP